MSHQELRELCALEAVGALEAEERSELLRHLEQCTDCRDYLGSLRQVATSMPLALAPQTPPPAIRSALLARARGSRPAPEARESTGAWWMPWVAFALAAGLAGILLVQVRELQRELELAQQRLGEQGRKVAELQRELGPIRAASSRAINLKGMEAMPASHGKAIIDPQSGRGVFFAYKLPPPPPGKTYQLWALQGDKPFDAGIFVTDADGNAYLLVQKLPQMEQVDAVAVTVEPAGGVPAPTGAMVLLGS
jgi:anti-sigma-K factor RskA